ncbi:hypothetical protein B0H11DRAFT_1971906 [Mycena galericulata]|nr:hypothetical protein B0H11DRAFT_1971906 [Mycena galericulata]
MYIHTFALRRVPALPYLTYPPTRPPSVHPSVTHIRRGAPMATHRRRSRRVSLGDYTYPYKYIPLRRAPASHPPVTHIKRRGAPMHAHTADAQALSPPSSLEFAAPTASSLHGRGDPTRNPRTRRQNPSPPPQDNLSLHRLPTSTPGTHTYVYHFRSLNPRSLFFRGSLPRIPFPFRVTPPTGSSTQPSSNPRDGINSPGTGTAF